MSGRQRAVRTVTRRVLVTAEHGGNLVPNPYGPLFREHQALLASHRGWDPGAASLARTMAEALDAPCFVATVTRLLVDLNRSAHNVTVFSEVTWTLPPEERAHLIEAWHAPHRRQVEATVARMVDVGDDVLHLGVHSFTPVLRGRERRADVALLYDPARRAERALAAAWVKGLRTRLPDLRVRRNHPYRGASDGLTTTLRRRFPEPRYLGVEIEINQRLLEVGDVFPRRIAAALVDTLPQ